MDKGNDDVATHVRSIISAFTSGLNVFKKIRERRRERRPKRPGSHDDTQTESDMVLTKSLKKGSRELQSLYDSRQRSNGDKFAQGDAIARSCLTTTLLKLNTALASLISSFVSRESSKEPFTFDIQSFTNLSNASRLEALQALHQLDARLSRSSQVDVNPSGASRRNAERTRKAKNQGPNLPKPAKSKGTKKSLEVARVPVKQTPQTQLVVIRGRNRRASSSSSSSQNGSKPSSAATTAVNSPCTSPGAAPQDMTSYFQTVADETTTQAARTRPRPAKADLAKQATHTSKSNEVLMNTRHRKSASLPHLAPVQEDLSVNPWIDVEHQQALYREIQLRYQQQFSDAQDNLRVKPEPTSLSPSSESPSMKQQSSDVPSRRISMLTASTRIGEISMSQWDQPFDYELAARLNEEAEAQGTIPAWLEGTERSKRGFWGFLRRAKA